jgi:choline-sulfatase
MGCNMTRRDFGVGLAAGLGGTAIGKAAAKKPNIVFICSDQHSGRFLGCNGHPVVRTPNMDRIAGMGVNFRNTYSGNPVCVPGRASMMSGMYASDVNAFCNSTPLGAEPTWGNYLRDAGYRCWSTGKLDLTFGADYGFEQTRTTHGHSRNPDITSLFRSPVCFRPDERKNVNGQFTDRVDPDAALARSAIQFIRERGAQKPWAIYVGMHMPHPKWIAEKKYLDIYPPDKMPLPDIPAGYLERRHTMFQVMANFKNMQVPIPEDRIRRARAAYFGMVSEVDEYVGWLLDEVEKSGQLDNTLFIYTSDHGEMLGEHGLWLKNVLLENAARVPLVMAGAGLPKGKAVATAVSHVDLVATMLELAGAAPSRKLRGNSLIGLANGDLSTHRGFAYSESHSEGNCTGSFLIRKGDWKYLYFTGDEPLLFNLKDDPGEFHNLGGKKDSAAIQKELHGLLTSQVDPDAVTDRAFAEQERACGACQPYEAG